MGLTLTRHINETIRLDIAPGVTPDELYDALLDGITVRLVDVSGSKAKIDVTAPQELQMYRLEASAARLRR